MGSWDRFRSISLKCQGMFANLNSGPIDYNWPVMSLYGPIFTNRHRPRAQHIAHALIRVGG